MGGRHLGKALANWLWSHETIKRRFILLAIGDDVLYDVVEGRVGHTSPSCMYFLMKMLRALTAVVGTIIYWWNR